MSIYALDALDDDHPEGCGIWVKQRPRAYVRDTSRPCTCGLPDAPYRYLGSHILPSEDDPRGGSIGLALIPSHITRDSRDDQPEGGAPWPWLRVHIDTDTDDPCVIITPAQARRLAQQLNDWAHSTEEPTR